MSASYCPACYGRKRYCRRCKTTHCGCSWSQCPKPTPSKKPKTITPPNPDTGATRDAIDRHILELHDGADALDVAKLKALKAKTEDIVIVVVPHGSKLVAMTPDGRVLTAKESE